MAGRVSSPVFVGRGAELRTVERALDLAAAGESVHLLVAGEAGVGKTRLTAEAARIGGERGFRVLRGDCVNVGGTSLPYGPIVEALRGLVADLDPADIAALAGRAAPDLARLVPGFGRAAEPGPGQFEWLQSRIFEALLGLFGRLAARSPVLLIVEDLHWADPATREAFAFLVRMLREVPVLIVGTFRSDELHRRHPLLPWLAELDRSGRVERLELDRLDRAQVAELMAAILGARPETHAIDEVFDRSGGNPFFAEELLETRRADGGAARIPPTLREILLAHVATVPETALPVLRVAAVAGRTVDHDLLAEVAGLTADELLDGLRAAVGGHLLVVEPGGDGERYAFRHALVQEAVYDDLLPGERRTLHRAFAEALDERPPGDGAAAAGHWAELAHHWAAAREDRRAFEVSLRAAESAMASYAFGAALHAYEHAIELWESIPDAPEIVGGDRIDLVRRAGTAAYRAAEYRRAAALRREAIAGIDPVADPLRAGMLREELARVLWILGDSGAALEAYRAAVETIPPEPPTAERARVVSGLGQILMLRSSFRESRERCEEAIAIARTVGARNEEAHALSTLGVALAELGDSDGGIAALEGALRLSEELGNGDDVGRTWVNLAVELGQCGDADRGLDVARRGIEAVDALGMANSYGFYLRTNAASFAYLLGDWEEARRYDEQALLAAPSGGGAELYRVTRGLPRLVGEGSWDAAEADLRQAFDTLRDNPDGQFVGPARAAAAELALWRGAPADALEHVELGLAVLAATDDRLQTAELCRVGAWAAADLADAARASRDDAGAAAARDRGEAVRARLASLEPPVSGDGQRRLLAATHAIVAAEGTRLAGAADPVAWRETARQWTGVGTPYVAAYALWREGEAALAAGDRVLASEALRASHAIAARLGAAPLRTAIGALARRARIDLSLRGGEETPAERPDDPFGLTPRERDVLALVAEGRTNRQIAVALFISESTAGVHVSNILGKLGVASRVEAASVALRLALVPLEHGPATRR